MSYDLLIFQGDPAAPAETYRPLDCRLAWRVLESAFVREHARRDRDEALWFLPTHTISVFIGLENSRAQVIRASIFWGDRSTQGDSPLPHHSPGTTQQQKADLTKIFIVLQTLAEKLGAQLYDPQRGVVIPRNAISRFVEEFDRDAIARAAMARVEEEELLRTADADEAQKAQQAVSFSPWMILAALGLLGYLGVKMADDGKLKQSEHAPVMQVLNEYQPASRRNAVPNAEIWVDDRYIVHRGVLKNGQGLRGLVWVIRADGVIIEERPADDEMAFLMARMEPDVVYGVQLKLYGKDDEAGRAVSQLITFSLPPRQ